MSANDLPEKNMPQDFETPEMNKALQNHLDDLQKILEGAVDDLKENAMAKTPREGFAHYYKLKDIRLLNYPKANDQMLQMLQYYSQKMLKVLQGQATAEAFNAGADIYSKWMIAAGEHSFAYEADKTQDMIDKNADWFVDGAVLYGQEVMADKAIGLTFAMQDTLYEIRKSEREELLEKQKGFLIERKKQHVADRLEALDRTDARTVEFVASTAEFIKNLPNTTEDGLHAEFVDKTRYVSKDTPDDEVLDQDKHEGSAEPVEEERALMSTVLHSYSYSEKGWELFNGGVELLKEMGSAEDVADFIFAVQPDMALSQMYKYREMTIIENKINAKPRVHRIHDMQSSVDGMVYSMLTLQEKAPERLPEFIGMHYPTVSEAYIEMGETAALATLYEATAAISGNSTQMRETFARRNLYQLIKQGDLKEAGIFLNTVHKKSGLPNTHMLVLLNENGDGITAASIPLMKNNKAQSRASILYKEGQAPDMAKIVHERPGMHQYISYAAGDRELELKNHFGQQIKTIAEKIQTKGITPDHTVLSKRWLAIDCKLV